MFMKRYSYFISKKFYAMQETVYNGLSLELYTPFDFQLRT